ncbi:hypothetical protein EMA8858_00201 [Emticicia aquatica]|uniref:Pentapeptide repeat-containing protein n=1 Tax=Emticicia aquatica TaxID=1681835 RepID=A0ABM9AK63_9BACT|nr:hypothetical protein [Emticicia aquatica]CAH0994094.1 hypothetical protein EMA8858_00201 [Emticicia aquatica]
MAKKEMVHKLEDVLSGKIPSFIIDDGYGNITILIKNYRVYFFVTLIPIEIPYDLIFDECDFFHPFSLKASSNKSIQFINKCYFNEQLWIRATCNSLHFDNLRNDCYIEFSNECKIKNITCEHSINCSIYILGGEYQNFKVSGNYRVLNFIGGKFENEFSISNSEIQYLQIENIDKINKFSISKDVFIENFLFSALKGSSNFFINETHINSLVFGKAISTKDNFIQFNQAHFNEVIFDNFTNFGNLYFVNIKTEENYTMSYVLNLASKTKSNTQITPKIAFKNSDMGKTTFINCDLTGFNLEFQSSKISEVFLAGTEMPLSKNIISKDKQQKRLALSQIKKIYENRGDLVEAGKYQAEEMNVYLQTLPKNWEKVNVFLNKWTNNHGQSWQRAFKFTVISSLIFFLFYTWSLYYMFDSNYFFKKNGYSFLLDYKPFINKKMYFFEFFNPTHKFDFIRDQEITLSFWSSFWDFFGRIFIGYGIYQLIAAFRKHGKK